MAVWGLLAFAERVTVGIRLLLSKASLVVVSFSPALGLFWLRCVARLGPGVLKTDKISLSSDILA